MQLNKFVATGGVCSRRKAVDLIEAGRVQVNNTTITTPGYRVASDDRVVVNGKLVRSEQPVYVLLHKPTGYLTTCRDEEGRSTVLDLCREIAQKKRLFPVGRLDGDSSGLLILTNDGEFAQRLAHPRYVTQKWYRVQLDRPLDDAFCQQLVMQGILLNDGKVKADRIEVCQRDRTRVDVWIHSGKNRIVRRMFGAGGFHVLKLSRIGYAGLTVRRLALGRWRYATPVEIASLKRKLGLPSAH